MKTPKKFVSLGSNPTMPESVRKAYELAATEAWICANTLAADLWQKKIELLTRQVAEADQICAAQTADILDLRKKLASSEANAETASSLAKEESSKANLQIATLSDAAQRAAVNAANISTQLEDLMINLQPTEASSAKAPPAEIQASPETPDDPPQDHVQQSATEDTGDVTPISTTRRAAAERGVGLLQGESELLAAAAVLIKAICRFHER
jgi:predicted  nucleic acid-binding Zn-ribbon protein